MSADSTQIILANSVQTFPEHFEEGEKLTYFQDRLRDLGIAKSVLDEEMLRFQRWLITLSDDQVVKHFDKFYNPVKVNLQSVFGTNLSETNIRSLAVSCIKSTMQNELEFYYHLSMLPRLANLDGVGHKAGAVNQLMRLEGWNWDTLRSLLGRSKGLIVCLNRYGLFRFIALEMALMGFRTWLTVNEVTFNFLRPAFESVCCALSKERVVEFKKNNGEPRPENMHLLKALNFEERSGLARVAEALRAGNVVCICVEGNTGLDGPWGNSSKSSIEFLNLPIQVKNGISRLAYSLGVAILPIAAVRSEDGSGQVIMEEPIFPPDKAISLERDAFFLSTMQSLYKFLEVNALRNPEQWEGWSALHRWRILQKLCQPSKIESPGDEKARIAGLLQNGKVFKIGNAKVAELCFRNNTFWVDLRSLRSYMHPDWARDIFQALSRQRGIDQAWIDMRSSDSHFQEQILSLLAYLKRLDLIEVSN